MMILTTSDSKIKRTVIRILFLVWTGIVLTAFYLSLFEFFGGRVMMLIDKFKGI